LTPIDGVTQHVSQCKISP